MRRVVRVASVFAWLVVVPTIAFAQAAITGVVRDSSGAVLPGVTVNATSPVLIEQVRTAVTDSTGQYRIVVQLMSADTLWSQSACNVTLNGELMTTIQTNGTQGKWIQQRLAKVELEAGLYELKLDFVKPGLQLGWIEFRRV